jgi:hypothetical protein
MPAANDEHNHSAGYLQLRLLCHSHTMSKAYILGTIRSTLTDSTEWTMLFSDTINILIQGYTDCGWEYRFYS